MTYANMCGGLPIRRLLIGLHRVCGLFTDHHAPGIELAALSDQPDQPIPRLVQVAPCSKKPDGGYICPLSFLRELFCVVKNHPKHMPCSASEPAHAVPHVYPIIAFRTRDRAIAHRKDNSIPLRQ